MGIDRSDEHLERAEVGRAEMADTGSRNGDARDADADEGDWDRSEYYEGLRDAAWAAAMERFQERWDAHRERWPEARREPVDRSEDPEGSWRGDSNRYLDTAANKEVNARYERIAEVERNVVSPAMREIEGCDSDRTLVGWEYRLKSADRLKDKVSEGISERGRSAPEAVMLVPDPLRYTFQYEEAHYTQGVRDDVARVKEHGFELVRLKNYWSSNQYRGINSQWLDPESGQRFEVQFHTRMSFEGKQLTHGAYERSRCGAGGEVEVGGAEILQRELVESIPVPPGADGIEEVRRDGR